jgi:type IV pilus assembly protein PilO
MALSKQDLMKLPMWQKALIPIAIILVLGAVWYFLLYAPNEEETAVLRGQIAKLKKDVEEQQKAKLAKVTLEAEIKKLEQELKVLSAKLPEEKEIPSLLSSVNEVGRLNGLDFAQFKQEKAVRKEYYSEIPVQIQVQGGFHQIALFLNRLGSLDRIIHISKLKMGKYKSAGGAGTIEASMEATTYKYESQPLPPKQAPGAGKKPAAPPSAPTKKGAVD